MSKRVLSDKQKKHLSRFELAKAYGRRVVADPALIEHYTFFLKRWKMKRKNTGIYQLAIMDFMNPPKVEEVDLDSWDGIYVITIAVTHCFQPSGVTVSLVAPDGSILEKGAACYVPAHDHYEYAICNSSLVRTETICRVTAKDVPGNVTEYDSLLGLP
jgi:hypothetical protein